MLRQTTDKHSLNLEGPLKKEVCKFKEAASRI